MKMSEFKYNLPEEKIAKYPPEKRGTTKLLVLDRKSKNMEHRVYSDISKYIKAGDVLVLNQTKVEKRRTYFLTSKGRRLEVLFLNIVENDMWKVLIKGARYVRENDLLIAEEDENISMTVKKREGDGFVVMLSVDSKYMFEKIGHTPIPPYMKRGDNEDDYLRYNTVFGLSGGSVASPTASLNMTEVMIEEMKKKGVTIVNIELNIGWGTFAPIREENIEEHKIHREEIEVKEDVARIINEAKKNGKEVWAVGTTVARTLESCTDENGAVFPYCGETSLYIYPGYKWKIVDHLITNFHMPDSSLILLVSSFAGKELIKKAYNEALCSDYKFLSYGDSMLII